MDVASEGEPKREEESSGEGMEEDEEKQEESMEEEDKDPGDVSPEGSDDGDESGLLEPNSEEEEEEDEEEVEDERAEELLGEDGEAGGDEEVIDENLMDDDVGEEDKTFKKTEDHLDSKDSKENPSISDLEINSPKGSLEPDDEVFDETSESETVKSNSGSSKTDTKSLIGSSETSQNIKPLSKPIDISMVRVEKWEKKEEDQEMKERVEGDREGKERGRKEKKGGG